MNRRTGLWSVVALLGLLGPVLAGAAPRLVIQRDGSAARPRSATSTISVTSSGVPVSTAELRTFPHDIYAPGVVRREMKPLSAFLESALRAPAQPAAVETLSLAIFRVDFLEDSVGDAFTGDGRFDLRTGSTGTPVDPPPHNRFYLEKHAEALATYYGVQSYGSLVIEATVFPPESEGAYHLEDTGDYGPWEIAQDDSVIAMAERFVGDAIGAVDTQGSVDFSAFDDFVVVHAGADFQGDIDRNSPYDIPSFTITLADSIPVNGGAAKVGRILVLPESPSQDGRLAALNGVFAHEFGHILELPDLYNVFNGFPQVGYFSLMDSGENIAAIVEDPDTGEEFVAEGIFPTSLDPWSKLQAFGDAVASTLIQESWEGLLEGAQVNPFLPYVSIDALEYFLIENRALDLDGNGFPFVLQDSTSGVFMGPVDDPDNPGGGGRFEYDAVLPGGGVLIWHVDDWFVSRGLPRGFINLDVGQRGVALEEADGIWDQGVRNLGRPEDAFYLGNNTRFAPDTVPSSAANDDAYSGITVEVTTVPDRFMGVSITRDLARGGWPVVVRQDAQVFTTPGPLAVAGIGPGGAPGVLFDAKVDVDGQQFPERGLIHLAPDGSPDTSGGTFWAEDYSSAMRSPLASSESFELRSGEPESTVVVGVSGNRPFLWNREGGTSLLGTNFAAPALTRPLIHVLDDGPDRVYYGSLGSLHAVTVPGTMVYGDTASSSLGAFPVAGPTMIPWVSSLDLGVGPMISVAYEGGRVELFLPQVGTQIPVQASFATDVRHLVAGEVDESPGMVAVTADSIALITTSGVVSAAWPIPGSVNLHPVIGDVDEDNRSEIGVADTAGTVSFYNADGSFALGWPKLVPGPPQDLKLVDVNGDGAIDVFVLDAAGRFHAWDGRGRSISTWPRPLGPYTITSSIIADLDGDGQLTWVATSAKEGVILAIRLPGASIHPADWRYPGRDPEGTHHQPVPEGEPVAEDKPDLEGKPLLVYPNPAHGSGVEIRFTLAEGQTAQIDLVDTSGRILSEARLDLRGGFRPGENAVRWDLANVAPGLYFCRLERQGPEGGSVDLAKIVVLR